MNKNLSRWSRLWRLGLGIFLMSWLIAGGPLWALVGLYPLATGAWGYSPLLALFASSQNKTEPRPSARFKT